MPLRTPHTAATLVVLVVLAAASRLLPHPPNFGPLGAIALFGAAAFPRRWMAVAVTFGALYASDLLLNNLLYADYYPGFYTGVNGWVYAGFGLTLLLGWAALRGSKVSVKRLGSAATGATLLFFLVTNFGVWYGSGMYPADGAGLLACYAAGLPFLLNSLLGNLFFTAVLFGAAHWLAQPAPQSRTVEG